MKREEVPLIEPEPEDFDRLLDESALCFPQARPLPFASFKNRYAGAGCYVIGRGPTQFDYNQLAEISDPIFFINDAVCLEKHATAPTFFFAHDPHMNVWLDGAIISTAVLPLGGKIANDQTVRNHTAPIIWYRWRIPNRENILKLDRDQIADIQELFLHTATIHPLIHFLWYAGFNKVSYIGCDCISDPSTLLSSAHSPSGYDPRLTNLSQTKTDWRYNQVRRAQDLLNQLLNLDATYLGTPKPTE